MQTPTTDELNAARSWIGTTETDVTFTERFDRHYRLILDAASDVVRRSQALAEAIEESLRAQEAVMALDQPSSMSADGNSISFTQNLVTLRASIKEFKDTKGTGAATIVKLRRSCGR